MKNLGTETSGYSGTPLAKKLGIKSGMTVVVVGFSGEYAALVAPLPEGVEVFSGQATADGGVRAPVDILHLFTNSRDELYRGLDEARGVIKQDGAIWVSWYKKSAKLPTEITEDTIRDAALPMGLVDVKVCAVDEKWSGLKLVIRKENRK
jgi:hypothetical protein